MKQPTRFSQVRPVITLPSATIGAMADEKHSPTPFFARRRRRRDRAEHHAPCRSAIRRYPRNVPPLRNAGNEPLLTLTATEAAFLSAAYDTIIPADALSPSGTDCGLVTYIDRQLAGAWGGGARLYRSGPFIPGKPEHGYQLPLTPREFFAAGIKATNAWTRKTYGKEFDRLAPADRDGRAQDAWRPARPSSRTSTASRSSRRCCNRRWRASSPIRSMAATATRSPGGWSAIPACRRPMPTRRWNIAARRSSIEPQVDRGLFLRSADHGQRLLKARRRGHGRHGLDRQHHGARAHQGGAHGGRARARRGPFAARRLRVARHPRRAQILGCASSSCSIPRSRRSPSATRPSELALPMRRWEVSPLGDGVGGAGTHWNGITWRFSPSEFVLRSHLTARYGRNAIPEDMTIQDWGVTYDELEPHYDRFEKLCGTSGKAGNLRGQKIEGGNVFEGPRGNDYPNKPLIMSQAGLIFTKAAQSLGYHPFPTPASNSSARLYQSRRHDARRMPVLRPLRILRLRVQCQGKPARLHPAGAAAGQEIRAAVPGLCQPPHLRQGGEEGPWRGLYRPAHRRRDRAAGRSCRALRLSLQQHAAAVDRRHRRTLRPGDRQRRGRQELLPADQFERDAVRRRRDQSVHRHRIVACRDR